MKALTADVPVHLQSIFYHANSNDHALRLRQFALDMADAERRLAQEGWTGASARLAVGLTDPIMWGAIGMTGGLVAPESVGLRLVGIGGRMAFGAAQGGVSGIGSEAIAGMVHPTRGSTEDFVGAGAMGIGFGLAFSPLAKAAAPLAGDFAEIGRQANSIQRTLEIATKATAYGVDPAAYAKVATVFRDGVVRAEGQAPFKVSQITAEFLQDTAGISAQEAEGMIKWLIAEGRLAHAGGERPRYDVLPERPVDVANLSAAASFAGAGEQLALRRDATALAEDLIDAPFTAFGGLRMDAVGQMKASSNPLTRLLGGIGFDAVGWRDKSVVQKISPSEWTSMHTAKHEADYMTVRVGAFNEWATEQGLNGLQRTVAQQRFNAEVYRYVIGASADASPAIRRVGDKIADLNERIAAMARNPGMIEGRVLRPLVGAEKLSPNRQWMPRAFDLEAIKRAVDRFGTTSVVDVIAKALADVRPHADPAITRKTAEGYFLSIVRLKHGMDVDSGMALNGLNRDRLAEMLQAQGVDDAGLAFILNKIEGNTGGSTKHLKERTFLNDAAEVTVGTRGGTKETLGFSDLLDTDADRLFRAYNRHMMGRVSLARWQIANPAKPDELLLDGIRTHGEWSTLMDKVRAVGVEMGQAETETAKDIANLNFVWNYIMGIVPEGNRTQAAEYIRMAMKLNFTSVMNQVGLAQIPEIGRLVSTAGFKAALARMPAMRRAMNAKGEALLKDGFARELEAATGIGTERIRGTVSRWDEWADPFTQRGQKPWLLKTDKALDVGKRITSDISLMSAIDMGTKRWTAKAVAQKIADMAHGVTPANWDRLRDFGMEQVEWEGVFDQIRKHATTEQGWTTDYKLHRLNLHQWNIAARAKFEDALSRWAKRTIQENDVGMMHRWMSSTWVQMFTQFRTFMIGAWTNQFMHQIHMRDFETFATFASTSILGSLTYAMQVKLRAIGRSDAEEYERKFLAPEKLAAAAYARASWSSVVPMGLDLSASVLGLDPLFDMRTSQLPSAYLLGNPTFTLADAAIMGPGRAVGSAIEHGEPSQGAMRQLWSVAPFQNFLPTMWAFNSLIADLP